MSDPKYLTLSDVCKAVPAIAGKQIHISAAWRWCRKGVLARNGQRIRLRHTRLGRRVVVPEGAVVEFLDALAAADAVHFDNVPTPIEPDPKPASTALRRRQIEQAEESCKKRGI